MKPDLSRPTAEQGTEWKSTACILCSLNCGIKVRVENGHLVQIRGDRAHPISAGYQCQKASRLDFYQNSRNRLHSPLRRRRDGTFEEISWEVALREIAAGLRRIRDTHGGHALAYYGGGGQGNHMGGIFASTLRAAMDTRYIYNSLAQEKTGGFWVNGRLFGRQTCHVSEDIHNSDYVLLIGTNPWQSHGFPQSRKVLLELAKDPLRTVVVIDPRRTETAAKADLHLQVKPGGDAHLMLALLGTIVQEGLENREFLEQHTTGWRELEPLFAAIPVDEYARTAGIEPEVARRVARGFAAAKAGCVRSDLGLEHSPHSTLNTYLSKLLFLLTGQFGQKGSNNLHTYLLPLIGHSKEPHEGGRSTRVTGMREISKFYPPNILPQEIDTDHPEWLRGLVVDSANPLMTAADTQAYRKAFGKLDLLVVIDVAMTETARLANYVLPPSSQFEKWESTFFNLEFPKNFYHLRRPILDPLPGTLPEPEIYRRLAVAMGEFPENFPWLRAIAKVDRRFPRLRLFPLALATTLKLRPRLRRFAAMVLHETLGAALPGGARVGALLWASSLRFAQRHPRAVRRAGIEDRGAGLGEALFERIMDSESGTLISVNEYPDTWSFIRHADQKIHLAIPEMLEELGALATEEQDESEYPFILIAGERRSYNANTILRESDWRKRDPSGALRLHVEDARALGLEAGQLAVCESARGQVEARVEITTEHLPGVASLPHGYGMEEAREDGDLHRVGPAINELTAADHCDSLAKTPFHKHIPVRIRPAAPAPRDLPG